jgi:hypothetical protein
MPNGRKPAGQLNRNRSTSLQRSLSRKTFSVISVLGNSTRRHGGHGVYTEKCDYSPRLLRGLVEWFISLTPLSPSEIRNFLLSFSAYVFISAIVLIISSSTFGAAPKAFPAPSDQSEVRDAVLRIFNQLKAGQYETLYDALPSSSRASISRERFVSALQRSRNFYQLGRIEIGAVRVAGNLAVVDTVMYGRITQPADAEGKLVVQQYLVREDGSWRVATGDRATIDRFLKGNPTFARRFPIKRPRAFIKQNGQWVEFNVSARPRTRTRG